MDDDQFQGGLSVQGGNPDPNASAAFDTTAGANTSYDTSASDSTELPPLDFEESTPAPEAEPQHDIDPVMSRKMDEALGGLDVAPVAPMATETPVAEPIQQPTDFASPVEEAPAPLAPVEAPVPPVAEPVQPIEAPVAPAPETTTMPGYGTNPFAAAPVEQPYAAPMSAAGATMADFASTPQSAQAPIQPMATAPEKKGPNKILIIALAAVLVIGIVVVAIVMMGQGGKKTSNNSGQQEQPHVVEPEEPEEVETKQIGTGVQGFVNVPEDWIDYSTSADVVLYKSKDGKMSIQLASAEISAVTAATFANGQLAKAQNEGASQPQMTSGATKKVGSFNSYEVNYYIEATKTWNFKYIFEATDNRTHYIWITSDEPGSDTITDILSSFTLVETPKETNTDTPDETTDDSTDETTDESTDIPSEE